MEDDHETIQDARVVGVRQLDRCKSCLQCKARVEPSTDSLGRCSNPDCRMLQSVEVCIDYFCAKFLLMANSKIVSLPVYSKLLQNLADVTKDAEISEEVLLTLPIPKTVTYNDKNIIISFMK